MHGQTLNATAASLLGFLHDGPMTGWDLVSTAQQGIGNFWTVTQSQVYRELKALSASGLVIEGEPGPRDRKPFTITAAGRTAFHHWISQDPAADQIRIPMLVMIRFAAHLPQHRLIEIVTQQRATHAERLAEYQHYEQELQDGGAVVGSVDDFRLATLRFGLRYEQAVLAWFDELPPLLGLENNS